MRGQVHKEGTGEGIGEGYRENLEETSIVFNVKR